MENIKCVGKVWWSYGDGGSEGGTVWNGLFSVQDKTFNILGDSERLLGSPELGTP